MEINAVSINDELLMIKNFRPSPHAFIKRLIFGSRNRILKIHSDWNKRYSDVFVRGELLGIGLHYFFGRCLQSKPVSKNDECQIFFGIGFLVISPNLIGYFIDKAELQSARCTEFIETLSAILTGTTIGFRIRLSDEHISCIGSFRCGNQLLCQCVYYAFIGPTNSR